MVSSSEVSITSGGNSRITFGPALSARTPADCMAFKYGVARSRSSIPSISPSPRTSLILGLRICRNRSFRYVPLMADWSTSCSFSKISRTALAAAQASGLPPKVEPCAPTVSCFTRGPTATAPIGMPPAIPLARQSRSGTMSTCEQATI